MRPRRQSGGYSLIELMIVIGLMGLLAVLVIPQYGKYRARQEAGNAAQEIMAEMRTLSSASVKMEDYAILQIVDGSTYYTYEGASTYPGSPKKRKSLTAQYPRAVISPTSKRVTFGEKGWVTTTGAYATDITGTAEGNYTVFTINVSAPGLVTYVVKIYSNGKTTLAVQ